MHHKITNKTQLLLSFDCFDYIGSQNLMCLEAFLQVQFLVVQPIFSDFLQNIV